MTPPAPVGARACRILLATAGVGLVAAGVAEAAIAQWLFVHGTYYAMMATVLCWAGVELHAAGHVRREGVTRWAKDNAPGLVLAVLVTLATALAVEPALRVLSDEANLVGVSRNLFASKTATLTVSGKNYYDSYWDIDVILDRRPTLFPFLVSLLHALLGYSYRNAFHLNLLVLAAFIFLSYRLAKDLGGKTAALVTALFVVAHPTALMTARSGAFDLFSALLGLLVVKKVLDHVRAPSPGTLATLWMTLCLFAESRYESVLFMPLVLLFLLVSRSLTAAALRPYSFVYALSPVYLAPRVFQAKLLGNVPEQEAGAITFSAGHFLHNLVDYFRPLLSPFDHPAHAGAVIGLGLVGVGLWLRWLVPRLRPADQRPPEVRFALFVAAWLILQAIISFTYVWGQAQHPSAARLFIALDTFFAFAAGWALVRLGARWRPFVSVLIAAAVLVAALPVAAQHRMFNRLTQTRESATTWKFFEGLPDKRILIVTDRPNHFAIMGYGAMSFEGARADPYLFVALERHLFRDVYVIQQIRLSTKEPYPGYETWPDRKLEPVLEFQNDADVLVRVSRVAH